MAKKIKKGKVLEELVKGSLDYTMNLIREAFRKQFSNDGAVGYYLNEIFSDHVIISDWGSSTTLKTDEYWKVTYSKSGDSYVFAERDEWEVVELAYKPQTLSPALPQMGERNLEKGAKRKGKRFEETITNAIQFVESSDGEKAEGPWRVMATGITADVINGNGRRYPAKVLEAAVKELNGHLHESAAQGRMLSLTGESDHPADKGNRRSLLSEVIFNWDKVDFDGQHILVEGNLLGTSKGKDIHAQMLGGVIPGISQRGYGASKSMKENDVSIEEVTQLIITGYDGTAPNAQSDPNGSINYFESQSSLEDDMDLLEQLKKLLAEQPELFGKGMTETQLVEMSEKQLKTLEEKVRSALGIDANANITESLKATTEKARKFDEGQKQAEVTKAIEEETKDLPFGKTLNGMFVASLNEANLTSPEAVKQFAESKRKEYGKLAAAGVLKGMGFDEKTKSIQVIGDVLELETGTPEFARASFEITESLNKTQLRSKSALALHAESRAGVFTMQMLERFDKVFERHLMRETQEFNEATLSTDLNLPYTVSRVILAEVYPTLVSANVFDVGTLNSMIERIYFEVFAGETGYTVVITDEVVTAGAEEVWYDLAHKNVTPGTAVVTSNPAGTTYEEGTDFVIDYGLGKIKAVTAGAIGANDLLVDYSYNAIANGENQEIERAKKTLSYQTVEAIAFRLADYITSEAIVFSRSQLDWDVVARTMANIIRHVAMDIDKALIEKALAAVLGVASNSGGTYDISADTLLSFVEKLGVAKTKIVNRFYEPTGILMSVTNSDLLSNWDGFKRDGFPTAGLNSAGFTGGVKGLPVFASTQMRDSWALVFNRGLVIHRVFQPGVVKGPFPTYGANGKLIAAEQYYYEEYSASSAPIGAKGSFVKIVA